MEDREDTKPSGEDGRDTEIGLRAREGWVWRDKEDKRWSNGGKE